MYYGDATRDGKIDVSDYAQITAIVLGIRRVVPGADATMDGFVDIADFSQVRAIMLELRTASDGLEYIYDFSSGQEVDEWAKYKELTVLPPALNRTFAEDSGWADLSQSGHFDVSTGDGDTSIVLGASANHSALQFRFTVNEPIDASLITSVGLTLNGSAAADGNLLRVWLWNSNTTEWTQLGSDISITSGDIGHTEWTANWGRIFEHYIDYSGYLYLLLADAGSTGDLNIDCIKFMITTPAVPATPPQADWWVLGAIVITALIVSLLVCLRARNNRLGTDLTLS